MRNNFRHDLWKIHLELSLLGLRLLLDLADVLQIAAWVLRQEIRSGCEPVSIFIFLRIHLPLVLVAPTIWIAGSMRNSVRNLSAAEFDRLGIFLLLRYLNLAPECKKILLDLWNFNSIVFKTGIKWIFNDRHRSWSVILRLIMISMLHVLNLNLSPLGWLAEMVDPFLVFFKYLCKLDEQRISVCKLCRWTDKLGLQKMKLFRYRFQIVLNLVLEHRFLFLLNPCEPLVDCLSNFWWEFESGKAVLNQRVCIAQIGDKNHLCVFGQHRLA